MAKFGLLQLLIDLANQKVKLGGPKAMQELFAQYGVTDEDKQVIATRDQEVINDYLADESVDLWDAAIDRGPIKSTPWPATTDSNVITDMTTDDPSPTVGELVHFTFTLNMDSDTNKHVRVEFHAPDNSVVLLQNLQFDKDDKRVATGQATFSEAGSYTTFAFVPADEAGSGTQTPDGWDQIGEAQGPIIS